MGEAVAMGQTVPGAKAGLSTGVQRGEIVTIALVPAGTLPRMHRARTQPGQCMCLIARACVGLSCTLCCCAQHAGHGRGRSHGPDCARGQGWPEHRRAAG